MHTVLNVQQYYKWLVFGVVQCRQVSDGRALQFITAIEAGNRTAFRTSLSTSPVGRRPESFLMDNFGLPSYPSAFNWIVLVDIVQRRRQTSAVCSIQSAGAGRNVINIEAWRLDTSTIRVRLGRRTSLGQLSCELICTSKASTLDDHQTIENQLELISYCRIQRRIVTVAIIHRLKFGVELLDPDVPDSTLLLRIPS